MTREELEQISVAISSTKLYRFPEDRIFVDFELVLAILNSHCSVARASLDKTKNTTQLVITEK